MMMTVAGGSFPVASIGGATRWTIAFLSVSNDRCGSYRNAGAPRVASSHQTPPRAGAPCYIVFLSLPLSLSLSLKTTWVLPSTKTSRAGTRRPWTGRVLPSTTTPRAGTRRRRTWRFLPSTKTPRAGTRRQSRVRLSLRSARTRERERAGCFGRGASAGRESQRLDCTSYRGGRHSLIISLELEQVYFAKHRPGAWPGSFEFGEKK
jgi:hypothetical protein